MGAAGGGKACGRVWPPSPQPDLSLHSVRPAPGHLDLQVWAESPSATHSRRGRLTRCTDATEANGLPLSSILVGGGWGGEGAIPPPVPCPPSWLVLACPDPGVSGARRGAAWNVRKAVTSITVFEMTSRVSQP